MNGKVDDLISRQAAIDAVSEYATFWMSYTDDMSASDIAQEAINSAKDTMIRILKEQPTVQPEQQWIPCSERSPSKDGKYIVTEKRYAVDDRNHDGKHTVIVEEVNWWGKWERAKFYEVTAWMPLPEPYRGGEKE